MYSAARHPITDFQLIRYVDTTAVDLVAVCGKCRRAAVVDKRAILAAEGANVWARPHPRAPALRALRARASRLFMQSRTVGSDWGLKPSPEAINLCSGRFMRTIQSIPAAAIAQLDRV
jgi:hypothetical protein